jgi:hypothetical protein
MNYRPTDNYIIIVKIPSLLYLSVEKNVGRYLTRETAGTEEALLGVEGSGAGGLYPEPLSIIDHTDNKLSAFMLIGRCLPSFGDGLMPPCASPAFEIPGLALNSDIKAQLAATVLGVFSVAVIKS